MTRGAAATAIAFAAAGVVLASFALAPLVVNPGFWNHDELDLGWRLAQGEQVWTWRAFLGADGVFYRPLGYGAFVLQMAATAADPARMHWLGVAHHVVNVGLFALVLRAARLPPVAALLLAFAPTAVLGVGWAAAVYDRLALTMLLFGALALSSSRAAIVWLAVPCFALALLTKETAVAFAPLAVMVALTRPRPVRVVALCILALACVHVLLWFARDVDYGVYAPDWGPAALVRAARYLAFTFVPSATAPRAVYGWSIVGGVVLLAALALVAWRYDRRAASLAVAVILLPLLPILGVRDVQGHYLYLASPGLVALVAVLARGPLRGERRPAVAMRAVACAAVVLLFAWHARVAAEHVGLTGRTMDGLARVHARLPPVPAVALEAAGGAPAVAAMRFDLHLEHCRRTPRLVPAGAPVSGLLVAVGADGAVQLVAK